MKYSLKQKGSSASQRRQQGDQLGTLIRIETLGELALNAADRPESLGVALMTQRGDLGAYGSAVLAAASPLDQTLRLEAVDELGDVRPHAVQATREVTEGERLPSLDELLHGVELRHGQPDGDECILEAPLQLVRRLEHRDQRTLVGARSDGTAGWRLVEHIVHPLKYLRIMY
jgi:hypothetical protein